MYLNTRNPNNVEDRKKKRRLLEAAAIETIRSYLQFEISDIAPAEWSQERRDELIEEKIGESQRIIDALTTSQLEDEFELQRHGESAVAELRMDVHRRISENRRRS